MDNRIHQTIISADDTAALRSLPSGSETVLLVEDSGVIRALVGRVLRAQGYMVLEAEDGAAALAVAQSAGPIHLLLSDMVMPGISGPDLALRLTAQRPALKVLFMSGYTDDTLAQQIGGEPLLSKPFTPADLARAVRAALDS